MVDYTVDCTVDYLVDYTVYGKKNYSEKRLHGVVTIQENNYMEKRQRFCPMRPAIGVETLLDGVWLTLAQKLCSISPG